MVVACDSFVYSEWMSLGDSKVAYDNIAARVPGGETQVIDELMQIIVKHDVVTIFGVSLLHRHFDMTPEEILVERFEGLSAITAPKKAAEVRGRLSPHTWKLRCDEFGVVRMQALEHIESDAETPDFSEVVENLPRFSAFIVEFYGKVAELNLLDTIGLNIIHRDRVRTEAKMLLKERTNDERMSVMRPVGDNERPGTIPTSWTFDTDKASPVADCCCNHHWNCK